MLKHSSSNNVSHSTSKFWFYIEICLLKRHRNVEIFSNAGFQFVDISIRLSNKKNIHYSTSFIHVIRKIWFKFRFPCFCVFIGFCSNISEKFVPKTIDEIIHKWAISLKLLTTISFHYFGEKLVSWSLNIAFEKIFSWTQAQNFRINDYFYERIAEWYSSFRPSQTI